MSERRRGGGNVANTDGSKPKGILLQNGWEVAINNRQVHIVKEHPFYGDELVPVELLSKIVGIISDPKKWVHAIEGAEGRNIFLPLERVGIAPYDHYDYLQLSGGFWAPIDRHGEGLAKARGRIILPPSPSNFAHAHPGFMSTSVFENGKMVVNERQYQPTGGYSEDAISEKVGKTQCVLNWLHSLEAAPFMVPMPVATYRMNESGKDIFGAAFLTDNPASRYGRRIQTTLNQRPLNMEVVENAIYFESSAARALPQLHKLGSHMQYTLGNAGIVDSSRLMGRFRTIYDLQTFRVHDPNRPRDNKLNMAADLTNLSLSAYRLFNFKIKNFLSFRDHLAIVLSAYCNIEPESVQLPTDVSDLSEEEVIRMIATMI